LVEPRISSLREEDEDRQQAAVWDTLLELYLSPLTPNRQSTAKALKVLGARDVLPYDATRALLVCTESGFKDGLILLYEQLGMYDDIIRFMVDSDASAEVVTALKRYGPVRKYLYKLVLRYLTGSAELLSRHQQDVVDILDEVEREGVMYPVEVVKILSRGGAASIGLVREYLKRSLEREKGEIDSVRLFPSFEVPNSRLAGRTED
jgi:hypothetical protein